jgi:hypothetical protein
MYDRKKLFVMSELRTFSIEHTLKIWTKSIETTFKNLKNKVNGKHVHATICQKMSLIRLFIEVSL